MCLRDIFKRHCFLDVKQLREGDKFKILKFRG